MRIRKPKTPNKLTGKIKTIEIEESLARFFGLRTHISVPNISWGFEGLTETDLLVIKPSHYAVSIEIKISKSDFNADFKKKHDHSDKLNRIREFYYAFPDDLVEVCKFLVPEHAGIISCKRSTYNGVVNSHIIKKAKVISKSRKLTPEEVQRINRLAVYRIWSLKKKIINLTN